MWPADWNHLTFNWNAIEGLAMCCKPSCDRRLANRGSWTGDSWRSLCCTKEASADIKLGISSWGTKTIGHSGSFETLLSRWVPKFQSCSQLPLKTRRWNTKSSNMSVKLIQGALMMFRFRIETSVLSGCPYVSAITTRKVETWLYWLWIFRFQWTGLSLCYCANRGYKYQIWLPSTTHGHHDASLDAPQALTLQFHHGGRSSLHDTFPQLLRLLRASPGAQQALPRFDDWQNTQLSFEVEFQAASCLCDKPILPLPCRTLYFERCWTNLCNRRTCWSLPDSVMAVLNMPCSCCCCCCC